MEGGRGIGSGQRVKIWVSARRESEREREREREMRGRGRNVVIKVVWRGSGEGKREDLVTGIDVGFHVVSLSILFR